METTKTSATTSATIASGLTEGKTTVSKGYYGWKGETQFIGANGRGWEIQTGKGDNGFIRTWCQEGSIKSADGTGWSSFSFVITQDRRKTLAQVKAQGTQKAITNAHNAALAIFRTLTETDFPKSGLLNWTTETLTETD